MKLLSKLALTGAAFAGIALVSANTPSAAAGGDAAQYKFRAPPVNAMGVTGIPDLRGKPVLIDFWGHN